MVINAHAHFVCKEIYSDAFWDGIAYVFSKSFGMPIEDVYKNVLPQWWAADSTVFVGLMEAAGIEKTIINHPDYGLSHLGEAKWSIEEINEWYVKQIADYPDKFQYVAGIDPRRKNALELLEKAASDWGVKGVKIYPPTGFYPDDRKFDSYYEKCIELGLTLHTHTAPLAHPNTEIKYANPLYLDSVAARFPDLRILIVHMGSSTWSYHVINLMVAHFNVYTEFSGHQITAAGMPEWWLTTLRAALDTPPFFGGPLVDRIMFGTDFPYLAGVMDDKSWVEWISNIPEKAKDYGITFTKEEIAKILHENAKKFFGF